MKRWLLCFLMMLIPCVALADTPETPLKKASFVYWKNDGGNKVFQKSDTARLLKEKLAARGYDLATQDIHTPEKSDVILVAYPFYHVPKNMKDKSFLWLLESPISATIPAKPEILKGQTLRRCATQTGASSWNRISCSRRREANIKCTIRMYRQMKAFSPRPTLLRYMPHVWSPTGISTGTV